MCLSHSIGAMTLSRRSFTMTWWMLFVCMSHTLEEAKTSLISENRIRVKANVVNYPDGEAAIRIIGGEKAKNTIPWAVRITHVGGRETTCTGTIIGTRWVVTAAHCLLNDKFTGYMSAQGTKIVYACHDLDSSACLTAEAVSISVHPCYTPSRKNEDHDDIAVLEMNSDLNIPPVLVDGWDHGLVPLSPGQNVTLAGFGITANSRKGRGPGSRDLMRVTVPLATQAACEAANPWARQQGFIDFEDVWCTAAKEGKDSCDGDSGGPAIVFHDDRPYLIGVLSIGSEKPTNTFKCAVDGRYGVYTKVRHYSAWLRAVVEGLAFEVLACPRREIWNATIIGQEPALEPGVSSSTALAFSTSAERVSTSATAVTALPTGTPRPSTMQDEDTAAAETSTSAPAEAGEHSDASGHDSRAVSDFESDASGGGSAAAVRGVVALPYAVEEFTSSVKAAFRAALAAAASASLPPASRPPLTLAAHNIIILSITPGLSLRASSTSHQRSRSRAHDDHDLSRPELGLRTRGSARAGGAARVDVEFSVEVGSMAEAEALVEGGGLSLLPISAHLIAQGLRAVSEVKVAPVALLLPDKTNALTHWPSTTPLPSIEETPDASPARAGATHEKLKNSAETRLAALPYVIAGVCGAVALGLVLCCCAPSALRSCASASCSCARDSAENRPSWKSLRPRALCNPAAAGSETMARAPWALESVQVRGTEEGDLADAGPGARAGAVTMTSSSRGGGCCVQSVCTAQRAGVTVAQAPPPSPSPSQALVTVAARQAARHAQPAPGQTRTGSEAEAGRRGLVGPGPTSRCPPPHPRRLRAPRPSDGGGPSSPPSEPSRLGRGAMLADLVAPPLSLAHSAPALRVPGSLSA